MPAQRQPEQPISAEDLIDEGCFQVHRLLISTALWKTSANFRQPTTDSNTGITCTSHSSMEMLVNLLGSLRLCDLVYFITFPEE